MDPHRLKAADEMKVKRGAVMGRAPALDKSPSSTTFKRQRDEVERGASAARNIWSIEQMLERPSRAGRRTRCEAERPTVVI